MLLFGRCRASVEISAQQFPKLAYVHVHCGALTKSHCFKVKCNYLYSIRIRPNSKDPLFGTALVDVSAPMTVSASSP